LREREKCKTCGHLLSDCSDPERTFYPQRHIDYAERERAAAEWRFEQLHKDLPYHNGDESSWAEERSMSHPYHYLDGVRIFVATEDLNPDDKFLGDPDEGSSPL
jgi:hypothetical protein